MKLLVFILLFYLTQSKTLKYKDRIFNLNLTGDGCIYKGTDLENPRENFVLYNNCSGNEFAWLQDDEHGYYLQQYRNESLFQRDDELEVVNTSCIVHEVVEEEEKRRELLTKQYTRVKILTDNLRYEVLGKNRDLLESSTINVVSIMKQIYLTMTESEYRIQIELDMVEHLYGKERFPWEVEGGLAPESVFNLVYTWIKSKGYFEQYHSVILLTGTPLFGNTIGIASMSSFCRGGLAIVESMYTDVSIAKVAAHELGHNLGMRHTTSYTSGTSLDSYDKIADCAKLSYSVMSPVIYGSNYIWDRCSIEWLRLYNEGYPYNCLKKSIDCTYYPGVTDSCFNSPKKICGNTVIDPGEECDCGEEGECKDPCCDPKTCKLKNKCSTHIHDCCDPITCTATKDTSKICRPSLSNICDREERCNGIDIHCPVNKKIDYIECFSDKNVKGTCYDGACVGHNVSCLGLKSSTFSVKIVGPCPRAIVGDVACGDLYCAYDPPPYYCTYINSGNRLQVKEGSKCGDNSYCKSGKCIGLTDAPKITKSPTINPTYKKYKKRCRWINRKKRCKKFKQNP